MRRGRSIKEWMNGARDSCAWTASVFWSRRNRNSRETMSPKLPLDYEQEVPGFQSAAGSRDSRGHIWCWTWLASTDTSTQDKLRWRDRGREVVEPCFRTQTIMIMNWEPCGKKTRLEFSQDPALGFFQITCQSAIWSLKGSTRLSPGFFAFFQCLWFWKCYQHDDCIFSGGNYWCVSEARNHKKIYFSSAWPKRTSWSLWDG